MALGGARVVSSLEGAWGGGAGAAGRRVVAVARCARSGPVVSSAVRSILTRALRVVSVWQNHGECSEGAPDLLQGQEVPQAHDAQGVAVQGW